MRYHMMRFDIWVCLLIGFVVSFGVGGAGDESIDRKNTRNIKQSM